MPDPSIHPAAPTDPQKEAAQIRLERDILYTLSKAGVEDVEVAMLLVAHKLAGAQGDPGLAAPDGSRIEATLKEVLDERPYLRKTTGKDVPAAPGPASLPGPWPVPAPSRPAPQVTRQEAFQRARGSRSPADWADYLRLRRHKR